MSEYEQGMNIFVRLPAELQRIVKQKLLDEFWVAMKQRPCELLDDRPFYWSWDFNHFGRFNNTWEDRQRICWMSPERFNIEFVPPVFNFKWL